MGLVSDLLLGFTLVTCISKHYTHSAAGIGNYSIACFVGVGKTTLEELTRIQICPQGSICYFKYYLNELLKSVIDAGCRSKKDCKTGECAEKFYQDSDNVTVIRARKDLVLCDECCYTGLCNKQGCGLVLDLTTRRCFGECTSIGNMNQCLNVISCESEQYMCTTSQALGAINRYDLGCQRKEMCELLMPISERDKCCDSDLCNVIPHFENVFHGNVTDDLKCPKNLIPTPITSIPPPTPITRTLSPTIITGTRALLSTMTTTDAATIVPPATLGTTHSAVTLTTQHSATKGPPPAYHRTTSDIPLFSTPRQLIPGIVIGRRAGSMFRLR